LSVPLRIALVVDPLSARIFGGEHAAGLARSLSARGHVVGLFGASFAAPRDVTASPVRVLDAGSHEHEAGAIPAERRLRDRQRQNGRRHLLEFAPQALIAYDAMSPTACLAAQTARRLRVPLVLVEHGTGGHVARTLVRGLSRVGSSLWGPYVRRTATCVVALDPWSLAQARREGFPLERVRVVPHGVDTQRFRPGLVSNLCSRHRVQGRVVLAIGPLESASRHELVVDAFARTVGRRSDWSLVIAGEGSQRARLRAAADCVGIGARVHWIGELSDEELPGALSSATIAVLAASDPRAVLLARLLACGVPIVAESGGRAEFLVGDQCGVTVARGAWAEGLGLAAGAPESRRRWSDEARRIAVTQLDWGCVAREFEAAIDDREERLAG
jgi:glycosyltransferase involved in cell wall biosynthesis